MTQGKSVIALIPARGGSKGLPRKNVLQAAGRPLISWTITAALKSEYINTIVLSSDDDEIIETAKICGCSVPFRRPPALSSDTATSMEVVLHALDQLPGYDYVVLLQPTSPLRTSKDIDLAFTKLLSCCAPSCVSVCEVDQSPYWMYRLSEDGQLHKILTSHIVSRRQDLPKAYIPNGAIYIARVEWLLKNKNFLGNGCIAYVMPKERSIDIDTYEDFEAFRRIVE